MSDTPNVILRLNYYPLKCNNEKFRKRREFYSGKLTDDYMRYIDKGIIGKDYIDYAGNEEKSSGVFNENGVMSKSQKAELRKKLRETQSVIWDIVISFKEGYGQDNLYDFNSALSLLRAQLNKFFRKAGLNPDNVIWYAGLHENTENKHIHLSFFEKEPLYKRQNAKGVHYHHGELKQLGIDSFKISIEQYFSENTAQLKIQRENTLAAFDAAKFFSDGFMDNELKNKMSKIISMLPSQGRLAYDSDNMILARPHIDSLTAFLLKNNRSLNQRFMAFSETLRNHDMQTLEICRKQKIKHPEDFLQTDKVIKDLYRRLGNKVIKLALDIKQQRKERRPIKSAAARRRVERKTFLASLEECLKLNAIYENECVNAFEEYLYRLEKAQREMQSGDMEMD